MYIERGGAGGENSPPTLLYRDTDPSLASSRYPGNFEVSSGLQTQILQPQTTAEPFYGVSWPSTSGTTGYQQFPTSGGGVPRCTTRQKEAANSRTDRQVEGGRTSTPPGREARAAPPWRSSNDRNTTEPRPPPPLRYL
nr:unnamed protein product [Callosobruchus chinensis]